MKKTILIFITLFTLLISSLGFSESNNDLLKERSIRLPQSIDHSNSKCLPEIGDQGYINSSSEWALVYYLRTYQQAKDLGWSIKDENEKDRKDRVFSPSFIYNQVNDGKNERSSFKEVIDIMRYQGVVTLDNFDENNDYRKKPDEETVSKAYPHRIKEARYIDMKDLSVEDAKRLVKESLVLENLPVLETYTGLNWEHLADFSDKSFITSYENLGEVGNHAVVIVGYDDLVITSEGRGAFKIVNSWGKDWGDNGYAYITYKAFEEHGHHLAFVEDLKNEELPVEDVSHVKVDMLSPKEAKYTWKPSENATGYYIYDENSNIIDKVYGGTEYRERVINNQSKSRYVQAFNAVYKGERFEFLVDPKKYDSENKLDYDRDSSRKIKTITDQVSDKEWNILFNRDILYGEYLKKSIFVVDEDNYIQNINIVKTSDKKKLKITPPKDGYKQDKQYTIVIKDVIDIDGNALEENTIMDFTVK